MSERYLVISADCHAAARWQDYEPYLEPRYREEFRAWYGAGGARPPLAGRELRPGEQRLFDTRFLDEIDATAEVERGGKRGTWDADTRVRELEADGVVGEVIFPGAENFGIPFRGLRPTTRALEPQRPELRVAGVRAYNRWLADLCAAHPERMAGVAVLPLEDIDAAVSEIHWARRAGLRGGVLLEAEWGELPSYNHPRYEPIWAACQELDLPVNTHPLGSGREAYGDLPGATAIFLSEIKWFAHRPLTFVLWAGVFERYPRLRFVLTEQMGDWVPETLEYFDDLFDRPIFAQIRAGLSLRPSEYFRRQCYVGVSFMVRKEVEMRHAIGLDRLMWGSDYPHAEGTWPHTREKMRHAFGGVDPEEIRPMVGATAAHVYGFEPAKLAPIVARVGLEVEALR
jgi:predicted TIM-barrel fold metal-dependent hydrolase